MNAVAWECRENSEMDWEKAASSPASNLDASCLLSVVPSDDEKCLVIIAFRGLPVNKQMAPGSEAYTGSLTYRCSRRKGLCETMTRQACDTLRARFKNSVRIQNKQRLKVLERRPT